MWESGCEALLPAPHSSTQVQTITSQLYNVKLFFQRRVLAVSPGCWTWRDPAGRLLLSPGPGRGEEDWQVAATSLHPAQQLGLAVRGGAEFGLGIYVTGVAPHSPAARLGLHVIFRYVKSSLEQYKILPGWHVPASWSTSHP